MDEDPVIRESRLVFILTVAFLILALAITAVYRGNNLLDGGARSKPRIAVILKTVDYNLAFWQTVKDGVESASKDFDVDFTILGPLSETQVDDQIQIIRSTILAKPDAIVLAATDYDRLVPIAKEIKTAGIPLVTIDSFINGNDADTKIGTDNYDAGQKAGAALMEHLRIGSRVVIMSHVQGTSTAIDRELGVRDFLQGRARVTDTLYSSGEPDIAYQQALRLLRTDTDVKGIIALNDPTTIGTARALADSGREREVVLIGFDNSLTVLGFVEAGVVRDTIVQRPFNMGYLGIQIALELIRGKRVEPFIDTGSQVINHQNMLLPENQKLLFPVTR
ncbi:MAG: substrate-binding domain-containing protein [Anaerolineales bacterium]